MDKRATVRAYSGYRNNRYDGYNCSRGIIMALGGSGQADGFGGEEDYEDAGFQRAWDGADVEIGTGENDEFRRNVLKNLDCSKSDIDAIRDLEIGDSLTHNEYWGDYRFDIVFRRTGGGVECDFDGKQTYICDLD